MKANAKLSRIISRNSEFIKNHSYLFCFTEEGLCVHGVGTIHDQELIGDALNEAAHQKHYKLVENTLTRFVKKQKEIEAKNSLDPTPEQSEAMACRRRGRKRPSKVPSRLTRTPAFVAKSRNLDNNPDAVRLYYMPRHSLIKTKGRELGSSHRNLIYALFRKKPKIIQCENPLWSDLSPKERATSGTPKSIEEFSVTFTWRELLDTMGVGYHKNNLERIIRLAEEINQVSITIYDRDVDKIYNEIVAEDTRNTKLPKSDTSQRGRIGRIFRDFEWSGKGFDDKIVVRYDIWVREVFEKKHLVSLNADVQFNLKSDYAMSIWPFIDSQPNYSFIDENAVAALVGRLPINEMTPPERAQFRRETKRAFDDMLRAGGIRSYEVEKPKSIVCRKYHYKHALHYKKTPPSQMDLFQKN